jgi:hypothetical protein
MAIYDLSSLDLFAGIVGLLRLPTTPLSTGIMPCVALECMLAMHCPSINHQYDHHEAVRVRSLIPLHGTMYHFTALELVCLL